MFWCSCVSRLRFYINLFITATKWRRVSEWANSRNRVEYATKTAHNTTKSRKNESETLTRSLGMCLYFNMFVVIRIKMCASSFTLIENNIVSFSFDEEHAEQTKAKSVQQVFRISFTSIYIISAYSKTRIFFFSFGGFFCFVFAKNFSVFMCCC